MRGVALASDAAFKNSSCRKSRKEHTSIDIVKKIVYTQVIRSLHVIFLFPKQHNNVGRVGVVDLKIGALEASGGFGVKYLWDGPQMAIKLKQVKPNYISASATKGVAHTNTRIPVWVHVLFNGYRLPNS